MKRKAKGFKRFLVDEAAETAYLIRAHSEKESRDMRKVRVMSTDPGLSGALCFCDAIPLPDGQYAIGNVRMYDMPVDCETDGKNAPSIRRIAEIMAAEGGFDVAVVERMQQRPGKANAFRMGLNYGILLAAISSASREDGQIVFAPPSAWKAKMGVTADKSTSVALANELLPLCGGGAQYKSAQDGRAEAFLLAHYYAAHVMPVHLNS